MRSFWKFPASVFDSYSLQKHVSKEGGIAPLSGGMEAAAQRDATLVPQQT